MHELSVNTGTSMQRAAAGLQRAVHGGDSTRALCKYFHSTSGCARTHSWVDLKRRTCPPVCLDHVGVPQVSVIDCVTSAAMNGPPSSRSRHVLDPVRGVSRACSDRTESGPVTMGSDSPTTLAPQVSRRSEISIRIALLILAFCFIGGLSDQTSSGSVAKKRSTRGIVTT